jgi:hypothetical protein
MLEESMFQAHLIPETTRSNLLESVERALEKLGWRAIASTEKPEFHELLVLHVAKREDVDGDHRLGIGLMQDAPAGCSTEPKRYWLLAEGRAERGSNAIGLDSVLRSLIDSFFDQVFADGQLSRAIQLLEG